MAIQRDQALAGITSSSTVHLPRQLRESLSAKQEVSAADDFEEFSVTPSLGVKKMGCCLRHGATLVHARGRSDLTPRTWARRTEFAESLVLEALQAECFLALHLLKTELDEVAGFFHLRYDNILQGVDSSLGSLDLD